MVDGCDFAEGTLLFGHRAPEVYLERSDPALGEVFYQIKFINTAPSDPLPDLIQLLVAPEEGQELRFVSVTARANGPLREASGFQEGTPGRADTTQTGLFMVGRPEGPFFPVERITVRSVGQ